MSYWAEIDESSIVIQVTVGDNNDPDEGYAWLIDNLGGTWIKTSIDGTIRKNFASIGFTYDPIRDAFIPPQTFPSWILNETTCQWEPPIPYPTDGKNYYWNEELQEWEEVLPNP